MYAVQNAFQANQLTASVPSVSSSVFLYCSTVNSWQNCNFLLKCRTSCWWSWCEWLEKYMGWDNVHACPLKNDWEMVSWLCLAASEDRMYWCCPWHTAPVHWPFLYSGCTLWPFVFLSVGFVMCGQPHWWQCCCYYSKTTQIPFKASSLESHSNISGSHTGQILLVPFLLIILFIAILWKINAASALVIIICISLSMVSLQS